MIEMLTYVACCILALLAIFQIALVAGAPIGRFAWGGQHMVLPTRLRIGSVIAVFLYAFFAAVLLAKAGAITLVGNELFVDIAFWLVTAYLFVGIFMNGTSRSKSERFVMTPVTIVLAMIFLLVGLH